MKLTASDIEQALLKATEKEYQEMRLRLRNDPDFLLMFEDTRLARTVFSSECKADALDEINFAKLVDNVDENSQLKLVKSEAYERLVKITDAVRDELSSNGYNAENGVSVKLVTNPLVGVSVIVTYDNMLIAGSGEHIKRVIDAFETISPTKITFGSEREVGTIEIMFDDRIVEWET